MILPELESIEDEAEIIDSSGKGLFSSLVSWVVHKVVTLFTGVDTSRYYIDKYTGYTSQNGNNYFYEGSSQPWCGPWVCGYLMWIKDGRTGNYYNTFYNMVSSVGEVAFLNFIFRIGGTRPMTPAEMSWALPLVSGGKIWFFNTWLFNNSAAYDYIKITKKPAVRLCWTGDALHWTVAVGVRRTGSVLSETFYFLQHENKYQGRNLSSAGGLKRDRDNEYTTVEWYNPWFLVAAP